MFSVVFLGTSAFAVPSLQKLAKDDRFKIVQVITQPDRPVGRKQILTPPAVKVAAQELSLPIGQPEKINLDIASLKEKNPTIDFLVVVSYGQILSPEVLAWPKIAAINVHASLLPLLRGASPLQHAILEEYTETGVTVQRMVRELDAGPILSQKKIRLDERETFLSLHDKLATIGADAVAETLSSPLASKEQDQTKATFCHKLTKADGYIDPSNMHAQQIDRMVRALTPWPGVRWGNTILLETALIASPDALALDCAQNSILWIQKIQPAGGKPMTGQAYARGRHLSTPPL